MEKTLLKVFMLWPFYPTVLKGYQGIVFTHGVRMGGRREKVFLRKAVSQKP